MNNIKNVVIVLPTYNEKGNIKNIINSILNQKYYLSKYNLTVLVVDDTSPDGTGAIVKKLAKQNDSIKIITGKKQGLGNAYIRGFGYAINSLHADILFEMDADFSHDPKLIPLFVKKIINGADVVIGSRYIKGGTIPDNWSALRKINSRFGNIFARHVGGLKRIKDCTSGFRAINVNIINKINLEKLNTKGYAFQISLIQALQEIEAKIYETPIQFKDRVYGKSKIRLLDIIEFIFFTIKLRFTKNKYKKIYSFPVVLITKISTNI